jgi:peptidoglycan/LPS O-acetylase OafA/YrhL
LLYARPQMVNIQEKLIRPSMPELDSLRGVAILLVLFFHGFGFKFGPGKLPRFAHLLVVATMPGWIGVNLFFVLSGFLITGILLDSKPHPQYYSRFYIRRALRILPAYYALLLLLAIGPGTGCSSIVKFHGNSLV